MIGKRIAYVKVIVSLSIIFLKRPAIKCQYKIKNKFYTDIIA